MIKKIIAIMVSLTAITGIAYGLQMQPDCKEVLNKPLSNSQDAVVESINKVPSKTELLFAEVKDSINGYACTKSAIEELRVK